MKKSKKTPSQKSASPQKNKSIFMEEFKIPPYMLHLKMKPGDVSKMIQLHGDEKMQEAVRRLHAWMEGYTETQWLEKGYTDLHALRIVISLWDDWKVKEPEVSLKCSCFEMDKSVTAFFQKVKYAIDCYLSQSDWEKTYKDIAYHGNYVLALTHEDSYVGSFFGSDEAVNIMANILSKYKGSDPIILSLFAPIDEEKMAST